MENMNVKWMICDKNIIVIFIHHHRPSKDMYLEKKIALIEMISWIKYQFITGYISIKKTEK